MLIFEQQISIELNSNCDEYVLVVYLIKSKKSHFLVVKDSTGKNSRR